MKAPARIAIVGCGAVTELSHLPAARGCSSVRITHLVDVSKERAGRLAHAFGIPETAADYREVFGKTDGVILAVPNHLHAPFAKDCLEHGLGVLVEKPVATTVADADALIETARRTGSPLAVGLMYRYSPAREYLRRTLSEGWLGPLRRADLEFGTPMELWPSQSGYLVRRELCGGGALLDYGSHLIDFFVDLFEATTVLEYEDDSAGGIEADASLRLRIQRGPDEGEALLTFSRLRKLLNRLRIVGDSWSLEYDLDTADRLSLTRTGDGSSAPVFSTPTRMEFTALYRSQLDRFAALLRGEVPPLDATVISSRSVLQLIEQSYASKTRILHPWEPFAGAGVSR